MHRFCIVLLVFLLGGLSLAAVACGSGTPAVTTTVPPASETTATRASLPASSTTTRPASTTTTAGEKQFEEFSAGSFANPTIVDNQWLPLKPGTQLVFDGHDEGSGEQVPHRLVFIVTDLVKTIGSTRAVVVWDRDYSDGVLTETELAFFAQDDDGNVWHLGEYPEVYEDGELVEAPTWIAGIQGAKAGIQMRAQPRLGAPSYSQGWGPAVQWADRARVAEMGQTVSVPFGQFRNVLVMEEYSVDEPNAFQLKYYAPGVGNVRVGWKGQDETKETLELTQMVQLTPPAMADVRAQALKLEKHAYQTSKDVYAHTSPIEGSDGD